MKSISRVCMLLIVSLGGIATLTGCGSGTSSSGSTGTTPTNPTDPTTPTNPVTQSILVSGKVLAGTQPVIGASVQIYSAGTTGNGMGATALLSTPVTTDTSGAFAITSGLTCSSTAPMVYLIARGGHIGSASANSAIALAATVGDCSKLSNTTTTAFTVNEVTTVAFTWALSQFLAADGTAGASSTNALGLANAFGTAANLVDPSQGTAPGSSFPSNGKAPTSKINTLANLLNRCITVSSACSALFSATTASGSSAPADTLAAAFQIARNPGNNVGVLYTQAAASTVFSSAVSAAPSDWTLYVSYSGGGLNAPTGVGVDSKGYIWVSSLNSVVSKFTPTGSAAFAGGITGSGISTPWGLAIDSADNVWIANEYSASSVNGGYGSITVLNTNGQAVSPSTGYTSGGLKYPLAVAIDPLNGNVWVVNYSNSRVSLLSSSGAPLSGTTGYGANSMAFIVAVAIDGNRNAWVGGQNDAMITQISPNISSGNAADNSSSSGVSCCNGPQNIATDQNGYVWIANFYGNSISQVSASGTVISPGYSGGAINQPRAIAVDGAGNVWAANYRSASSTGSPTLAQLAGAKASLPGSILSPATGYLTDAKLIQPYSMAIDASGNLWITNFDGGTATSSNTITQVIGMAVPIKTPLIGTPQTP